MVDHIINNDVLTNNTIKQQQELLGIEKKTVAKNPYGSVSDLSDRTEISDEALKLFEQEKEIDKYRQMVMDALTNTEETDESGGIIELIEGEFMSTDELAGSLSENKDFMDILLPNS